MSSAGRPRGKDAEAGAMITFTVLGEPRPRGSTRAFVRGGRAHVTDGNARVLRPWLDSVAAAAAGTGWYAGGAVQIGVDFYLPRPKALPKTKPTPHTRRPDLDKLVRGVLDGLTGVVFRDDSQVVRVTAAKYYASLRPSAGGYDHIPRAEIRLRSV